MDLGFGQMMAVVGALHPDVGEAVVRARLKYFQRIRFPPSDDIFVGTGERARYDASSLMKLVLAFELLAAGVAPQQAAALVDGGWDEGARGLATGWITRSNPGDYHPVLVTARVVGLESKRAGTGVLTTLRGAELSVWTKARDPADRRILVIEAVQLARALAGALAGEIDFKVAAMMARAIDDWAAAKAVQRRSYGT